MKIATFILLILFHLFFLINIRFTVWPEMILYPWLINNGYKPYQDIINPYFPLLPVSLSFFFSVFGVSVLNLKIFTYTVIIISDLVIFWSAHKLTKNYLKAFLSLILFILLQIGYGGNGLWFELALMPFLITAITFIYAGSGKLNLILSGFLITAAILIKQNSVLFLIPIFFLIASRKQLKNVIYIMLPLLLSSALIFTYLTSIGTLKDFYFWAINLPLTFSAQPGFVYLPHALRQYLFIAFPIIPLIGILASRRFMKNEKIFWALCFFIALSFAFPRYEDFHLQVLIGLSAIFATFLNLRYLIIFFFIALFIFTRTGIKNWHQEDRFLDKETYGLADRIRDLPSAYLLNSPDLAYFLAGKLPPKLWAANFPWYFEQPGFEDRFIDNLKKQEIQYIVVREGMGGGKYELGNYFPQKVIRFIQEEYLLKEKWRKYAIWERKLR